MREKLLRSKCVVQSTIKGQLVTFSEANSISEIRKLSVT